MRTVWLLLMISAFSALSAADEWSRFRGPNGAGVGAGASLPTEFGPTRNVAWKAQVPFGRSSPIVSGGRLFLTASEGNTRITLAFDAANGRQLWRRELTVPRTQATYKANDAASPTPAADGRQVYVFFPDFGLVAYSFDGKERWRHALGPFQNFYGMSSSPIAANGLVFLLCDQTQGSFLIALDGKTGRQRWRTGRAGIAEGWSVPIVHNDQLLVFGTTRVDSYFLSTGESRWWIPLNSNGAMGSPVISGDSVIVTASGSDQPWLPSFEATAARLDTNKDGRLSIGECQAETDWFEHFGWVDANHDKVLDEGEWKAARAVGVGGYGAVAIPLDGRGKLETEAVRWRFKRNLPYVPAPLLYQNVLYMVKDGGIVTSLDPVTGELFKQGRAPNALGQYLASPVAAGGKVFLLSEEGKLTVLEASPQWTALATNDLEEECYATPAIADGRIFVRTRTTLYSFGAGH